MLHQIFLIWIVYLFYEEINNMSLLSCWYFRTCCSFFKRFGRD